MGNHIPKDIKSAVLASSNDQVPQMIEMADALREASKADNYKEAVESLARVFNLAEKAEEGLTVTESFFENDAEKALFEAINALTLKGTASQALQELFGLTDKIIAFFDNTMVMVDDQKLKNNRLALLASLVEKANKLAKFNLLNTK